MESPLSCTVYLTDFLSIFTKTKKPKPQNESLITSLRHLSSRCLVNCESMSEFALYGVPFCFGLPFTSVGWYCIRLRYVPHSMFFRLLVWPRLTRLPSVWATDFETLRIPKVAMAPRRHAQSKINDQTPWHDLNSLFWSLACFRVLGQWGWSKKWAGDNWCLVYKKERSRSLLIPLFAGDRLHSESLGQATGY